MALSPQEFFDRANALMAPNPPPGDDEAALTVMKGIGVGPDLAFDANVLGSDYQERWEAMLSDAPAQWTEQSRQFKQQWGAWEFYGAPIAEFGTSYSFRALAALDDIADRDGVSRAEVVRRLVDRGLNGYGQDTTALLGAIRAVAGTCQSIESPSRGSGGRQEHLDRAWAGQL